MGGPRLSAIYGAAWKLKETYSCTVNISLLMVFHFKILQGDSHVRHCNVGLM